MDRVTRKHLDGLCNVLNQRVGFKKGTAVWARVGNTNKATIGMFYIDGAYGGWSLYRVVNESGGVSDVLRCGHQSARDLYNRISAYIEGWEDHEEQFCTRKVS